MAEIPYSEEEQYAPVVPTPVVTPTVAAPTVTTPAPTTASKKKGKRTAVIPYTAAVPTATGATPSTPYAPGWQPGMYTPSAPATPAPVIPYGTVVTAYNNSPVSNPYAPGWRPQGARQSNTPLPIGQAFLPVKRTPPGVTSQTAAQPTFTSDPTQPWSNWVWRENSFQPTAGGDRQPIPYDPKATLPPPADPNAGGGGGGGGGGWGSGGGGGGGAGGGKKQSWVKSLYSLNVNR